MVGTLLLVMVNCTLHSVRPCLYFVPVYISFGPELGVDLDLMVFFSIALLPFLDIQCAFCLFALQKDVTKF